jgi:26S proteasome regulatory subunit N11
MVVGWYHSHPGFGCWLSGVDVNTQQSFEQLNPRAVAVVVDPIQSVKGKVVIDAFRCINPHMAVLGHEPRQTTSNVGHLNKPSIQALIHGLNRHYYSIAIDYRKSELEQAMLLNLHKQRWRDALALDDFHELVKRNEHTLDKMLTLATAYTKWLRDEAKMDAAERAIANVGRREPKRHLGDAVDTLLSENVQQCLGTMLHTVIF